MAWKGEHGYNPKYPGVPPLGANPESMPHITAYWPNNNNLDNPVYYKSIKDYYICMMNFLD